MKANLSLIIIFIMIKICVVSCNEHNGFEEADNTAESDFNEQNSAIIYDNSLGICTVIIYSNPLRREEDKITEVLPGICSDEIPCEPNPSFYFYISYLFELEGIKNFSMIYTPDIGQLRCRIDPNLITTITLPSIEDMVSEEQLLSAETYLLINNNSIFSFELLKGASLLQSQNLTASLINPYELALYTIEPGAAGSYKLLVNGNNLNLADIDEFEKGYFYTFTYNGDISMDYSVKINIENIARPKKEEPPVIEEAVKSSFVVPGATFAARLLWLQTNSINNGEYIIEVDNYFEGIPPTAFSYTGKNNITITITGIESKRTISPTAYGSLFTVGSGVTLILDNNITLEGRPGNNTPLVNVSSGGTLIMNEGSVISKNSGNNGGGVLISNGAIFKMNGGTISDNTANWGGGVYVNGTFNMNGGSITGNIASTSGGGVSVSSTGLFTMNGGTISENIARSYGGGVYVTAGYFNKTGGIISGYTSDAEKGNAVKSTLGSVLNINGHAVYGFKSSETKRKEKTTDNNHDDNPLVFDGRSSYIYWSGIWDF